MKKQSKATRRVAKKVSAKKPTPAKAKAPAKAKREPKPQRPVMSKDAALAALHKTWAAFKPHVHLRKNPTKAFRETRKAYDAARRECKRAGIVWGGRPRGGGGDGKPKGGKRTAKERLSRGNKKSVGTAHAKPATPSKPASPVSAPMTSSKRGRQRARVRRGSKFTRAA